MGPRTCTFAWFSGALQCHRKGWPGQELLIWGAHWFTNEGTGGPRRKVCVALPLAGHSRSLGYTPVAQSPGNHFGFTGLHDKSMPPRYFKNKLSMAKK